MVTNKSNISYKNVEQLVLLSLKNDETLKKYESLIEYMNKYKLVIKIGTISKNLSDVLNVVHGYSENLTVIDDENEIISNNNNQCIYFIYENENEIS